MRGLNDERDIALLSIISGIFILTTLSSTIGMVYFAMAAAFAIALNQGKGRVIEFSGSPSITSKAIFYGFLLVMAFVSVGAVVLGSQEAFIGAVTFFASSFLANFTIDNPAVRFAVFGFFIPVVETLFFFGLAYRFILTKAKARNSLNDSNTWVAILMIAGIATAFHFAVRLLNDQSLYTDLLFFGMSAVMVTTQKELSGAAVGHIAVNSYVMAVLLGLITRLI